MLIPFPRSSNNLQEQTNSFTSPTNWLSVTNISQVLETKGNKVRTRVADFGV
jgi:2-hydroxychromene-2-carboxylate isomerase